MPPGGDDLFELLLNTAAEALHLRFPSRRQRDDEDVPAHGGEDPPEMWGIGEDAAWEAYAHDPEAPPPDDARLGLRPDEDRAVLPPTVAADEPTAPAAHVARRTWSGPDVGATNAEDEDAWDRFLDASDGPPPVP